MSEDERFARGLQAQFDKESKDRNLIEKQDRALAKTVAKAHTISDSDNSDDESTHHVLKTSRSSCGSTDLFDTSLKAESVSSPSNYEKSSASKSKAKTLSPKSKHETASADPYNDNTDTDIDVNKKDKPICKYGNKCYRKNPSHVNDYFHPNFSGSKRKLSTSPHSSSSVSPSPRQIEVKKRKLEGSKTPLSSSVSPSSHQVEVTITKKSRPDGSKTPLDVFNEFQPFSFFLSKVKDLSEKFNSTGAFSLKDILSPHMGDLKESCHFNFMFDLPWLMAQYAAKDRKCPVLVVHGNQGRDEINLKSEGVDLSNISFCRARLDIPYGTHHTKMMLLLYKTGLRIVIHTANLISNDWHQKTQGLWISPVFPPLEEGKGQGDSLTGFKTDFLQYIGAYRAPSLARWEKLVKGHDMSQANVHLVGSVPGRHTLNNKSSWGHLKLRKILQERGPDVGVVKNWPVCGQFSSIGSLGPTKESWLLGEFGDTLNTCKKSLVCPLTEGKCKLVFPSVNNIGESLEGYNGGGCVPYSIKTAAKQKWLTQMFNQWRAEGRGRSIAVPHIKTYSRFSPDGSQAAWFMVTSANLSKAAWGAYEKQKSQLMIRSYELGVLFLPQPFGVRNSFPVTCDSHIVATSEKPVFPLPYELPPTSYVKGDRPWFIDVPCIEKPDRHGTMWCPPL